MQDPEYRYAGRITAQQGKPKPLSGLCATDDGDQIHDVAGLEYATVAGDTTGALYLPQVPYTDADDNADADAFSPCPFSPPATGKPRLKSTTTMLPKALSSPDLYVRAGLTM
ncbi:hypothetical protein CFE70_004762 [Pyrenophora teres f. teres 0-1]